MNIKVNKNLNENAQKITPISQQERKNGVNIVSNKQKMLETILSVKSKQIIFSSGAIMGKIRFPFDDKISLSWHYNNTSNFDDFLKSVESFLSASGTSLIDTDKQLLETEYNLMIKH